MAEPVTGDVHAPGRATDALSEGAITREAGRIGAATMLSRVLGLVRDIQFAALFGTSRVADAFNLAFVFPNTLRHALAEGAVRSAFVPVLSDVITREGRERGREVARRTVSFWVLILLGVSVLGSLLAWPMVRLYAWDWKPDSDVFRLAVHLTRAAFPFIMLTGLTALAGGILNAYHRYTVPALAPVAFNLLSIAAAYVLCPRMGGMERAIWGFTIGTMAGGIAALAMNIPGMRSLGIGLDRATGWRDPAVRQMAALLVPAVLGTAVFQINTLVDTVLAVRLNEGAVTALRLAERVSMLPLGVFGVAVNTASLPSLSSFAAVSDHHSLRNTLGFSLRVTFGLMAPTCLGIIFLATPIVRLLFEHGAFTSSVSTALTAQALLYMTIGLPPWAAVKGLSQAFYAYQDTRTPFTVAVIAMGANVVLDLVLMGPLGVGGLALATSLSGFVDMGLLAFLLHRRGAFAWRLVPLPVLRILAIAAASAGVAWIVHHSLWHGGRGSTAEIVPVLAAVLASGVTYAVLAAMTRTREVTVLWDSYLRRPRQRG